MADSDGPPGWSSTPPEQVDTYPPPERIESKPLPPLDQAHQWFREKGNFLNPHAADALGATWFAESSGDPYSANKAGSGAIGFAQWLGPRKDAYLAQGDFSPQGQAKFAMGELASGRYPRSWAALNNPNMSKDEVQRVLIDEFEAPGGSAEAGYGPAYGDEIRAREYRSQDQPPPGSHQSSDAKGSDVWVGPDGKVLAQQPQQQAGPPGWSAASPAQRQPAQMAGPPGWTSQAPGPQDPSIQARQRMPAQPTTVGEASGAEGAAAKQAFGSGVAKWLADKMPSAKTVLDPNFLSDKLGDASNWTAEKIQSAAEETFKAIGLPNAGRAAQDLTQYVMEFLPMQGGLGRMGFKPPTLAEGGLKPEAGVERPPGSGTGAGELPGQAAEAPKLPARPATGAPMAPEQLPGAEPAQPVGTKIAPFDPATGTQAGGLARPARPVTPTPASAGAAATPLGKMTEHNIQQFEAANKAPGFTQRMKDATNYARSYFEDSGKAKAFIRQNLGNEKRLGAQAKQAMLPFRQMLKSATIDEQLDFLQWLEDPQSKLSKGIALTPEAQKFVTTFKDWMQTYRKKLDQIPQAQRMNFVEDFVTHLWRKPSGALKAIQDYGAKQGSNYFTKGRVFGSYAEGIRAGLAPVTTDPMELFDRYIENASQKIASWESYNDAKQAGMIVYRTPQNAPMGWVPLKSIDEKVFGQQAYAPPGLAKVFDNYASQPARMNIPGTQIDTLDVAQRAANTATAFKLSISGFHPALETMEGLFSGIANGLTAAKNGRPIKGIADVLTSIRKPITSYTRGRQLQQAYLDGTYGTPEMKRIVQALTDANYDPMREGGLADEYRASRMPGFIKGWTKGISPFAGGPLKFGIRAFETAMEPTFQYYVPWLKNQAAYDAMKTWLDAHPQATDSEFATIGRRVADMMDARFGEMNKNNIFWNATAKRMAQTAAISWSFTLGQARQVLGATWDAARMPAHAVQKVKGTLPITEEVWTDRMSYAVAIGLGTALVDSVYQYLKTGQPPQSGEDLLKPRTGGTDPSTQQPERATLPNFANSYMNIWNNGIVGEAYNKMAPLWQTLIEAGSNKDWKDQLIRDPNDTVPAQLEQLGKFAGQSLGQPITISGLEGAKKGSHIGSLERMFGVRAAGMRDTAPDQFKQVLSYKNAEAWYEKRRTDINQQRAQQGMQPLRLSHFDKQHLIEQYMKNPQSDPLQKYGGTQ